VLGKRSVQMVRLGIALISVLNASSALAAIKAESSRRCGAVLVASEASDYVAPARGRRPPRVPRREPYLHGEWRIGGDVAIGNGQ
jgi:hypothetical protein